MTSQDIDPRLSRILAALAIADRGFEEKRGEREPFHLLWWGGGGRGIKHGGWEDDDLAPTDVDVDDLADLGLVRVLPTSGGNKVRKFSLTPEGRRLGLTLAGDMPRSGDTDIATTPSLPAVLKWIIGLEKDHPESLANGEALLEAAQKHFRLKALEPFALHLLDLKSQGLVTFEDPLARVDQATDSERVEKARQIRLTMAGHSATRPDSVQLIQIGEAAGVQIAGRDIRNYVTFNQLLDDAAKAIDAARDADPAAKEEARTLIDRMRGKSAEVATGTMTGAGGALLGGVLKQLLGLE
jgi:hypothetical protein